MLVKIREKSEKSENFENSESSENYEKSENSKARKVFEKHAEKFAKGCLSKKAFRPFTRENYVFRALPQLLHVSLTSEGSFPMTSLLSSIYVLELP